MQEYNRARNNLTFGSHEAANEFKIGNFGESPIVDDRGSPNP